MKRQKLTRERAFDFLEQRGKRHKETKELDLVSYLETSRSRASVSYPHSEDDLDIGSRRSSSRLFDSIESDFSLDFED